MNSSHKMAWNAYLFHPLNLEKPWGQYSQSEIQQGFLMTPCNGRLIGFFEHAHKSPRSICHTHNTSLKESTIPFFQTQYLLKVQTTLLVFIQKRQHLKSYRTTTPRRTWKIVQKNPISSRKNLGNIYLLEMNLHMIFKIGLVRSSHPKSKDPRILN